MLRFCENPDSSSVGLIHTIITTPFLYQSAKLLLPNQVTCAGAERL